MEENNVRMFSKLTFSLVFVLMVALVAGPAFAQTQTMGDDLNDLTELDDPNTGSQGNL